MSVFSSLRHPRKAVRRPVPVAALSAGPNWSAVTVPAVQQQYQSESGPHPVLPAAVPPGARPEEDASRYWPLEENPYPTGPQPSFTPTVGGGYRMPANPERQQSGSRHTQAWKPEFAEEGELARPYVPDAHAHRRLLPALPPGTVMMDPAIGDDLRKRWRPAEAESEAWKARQQTGSANYPKCGLSATFGDYAAFLRETDRRTGTRGTDRWPLAALPPADERWSNLAASTLEAAEVLDETDPWHAQAYRRLHEVVIAAPDYATALKAAQLAADAGITRHVSFTPVAPGQAGEAAPEGGWRGVLAAAVWKAHRHYADNPANLGSAGKAGRYADLHDGVVNADDDGLAVFLVLAAIRSGRASLSDIAERGSALEALFTGLNVTGSAA